MALSISSERAFSSVGITISKHHNQLKSDIVKALQFLKCVYHCDLLFCEDPHAETEVEELDNGSPVEGNASNTEEEEWDIVVEDLQDDEGFEDYDDGDVSFKTFHRYLLLRFHGVFSLSSLGLSPYQGLAHVLSKPEPK